MIAARDLHLAFGGPALFEGIGFEVHPGERACIVGRNGAGKSSLLKTLAGLVTPDDGEVFLTPGARVAYLPQELPDGLSGPVADVISAQLPPEAEPWEREATLEKLLRELELSGKADFETLSVGMKRRALLGRALAIQPAALLLDEPTNHLDLASIEWLERFLPGFRGALLFVTHDRAFLQNVATRILDLERGKLISWNCSYAEYLKKKEAWLLAEAEQRAQFDKKLAKEEAWIRQGIKARRTRNEGRVRALEKMREAYRERREREGSAHLELGEADRTGVKVLTAEDLDFAYDDQPIVEAFSCTILRGDKVGLIGPNGAGKTTLLKLLLGELTPDSGTIKHGTNLQVAYFDQLKNDLNGEATLVDTIGDGRETVTINGVSRNVMGYLQDFLFAPEQARGKVRSLSGGERNRLLLARLFTQPCNVLVMDEPTNDLDLETLELLENLLVDFGGTLLLVSHDRAFIDNVCTSTFFLGGDGRIRQYVGGYHDALATRARQAAATRAPEAVAPPKPKDLPEKKGKTPKARKFLNRERWELEALPGEIEALENEQAELGEAMADPAVAANPAKLAEAQSRLAEIEANLEQTFARWEELETLRTELEG
ncbi:MAG: ATP-binding cassette domain-containing protein [Opitutales bacterium]